MALTRYTFVSFVAAVATAAAALFALYVVPKLIEMRLAHVAGPFVAYVIVGDLTGSLAMPAMLKIRWKISAALYLVLTAVEALFVATGIVPFSAVAWFADFVPASFVAFSLSIGLYYS